MMGRIGIAGLDRTGSALAARHASEAFAVTGWTLSGGDEAALASHRIGGR
jgi:hypothetical protein